MTESAPGPGARLKSERERRGLTLQKAADEMRLDAWVIEALEADDYARIGPSVYAKGHLKKYASVLGMFPDEILAGYETLRTAPDNPPQVAPSMRMRAPPPDAGTLPRAPIAALAVLLLAALGVFFWKPWQHHKWLSEAVVTPAPAPAAASAMPLSDPDHPVYAAGNGGDTAAEEVPTGSRQTQPSASDATATTATGAGPAAGSTVTATDTATAAVPGPGHGPTRLRLSFSAESWVDIHDADGKRVYSGYGRANSVKSLAGDGPLKVYLGYASGVQLEINEHAVAIASAFVHGDVARFQAGADGVLRSFTTDTRPAG